SPEPDGNPASLPSSVAYPPMVFSSGGANPATNWPAVVTLILLVFRVLSIH
ncbi:hypothetical protein CFC21_012882, partial [Triticum aestivum]